MKQTLTTDQEFGNVRVDKLLAVKFPEYSRAALTKLFELNLIKLNGIPIQPGHKLKPGTEIEYDLGPLQAKPEIIPLPIIYEDNDVLVIDKPAGIISHARGRFWQEASVASFIRDRISGMDGERGGIVHRLDRATSGVMICAKNEKSLSFLQKQFSERKVSKTYAAVITGQLKEHEAIIDLPIARDPKDPKRFRVDKDGKTAQTHFKVVKTDKKHSTLELSPKTGRTHQLRVHLLYLHHPIVGDELYGGETYTRLMLHAHRLRIRLPSGEEKTFCADIPNEFETIYA